MKDFVVLHCAPYAGATSPGAIYVSASAIIGFGPAADLEGAFVFLSNGGSISVVETVNEVQAILLSKAGDSDR